MTERELIIKALEVLADHKIEYVTEMPDEYKTEAGFPDYQKLAKDALVLLREQEDDEIPFADAAPPGEAAEDFWEQDDFWGEDSCE